MSPFEEDTRSAFIARLQRARTPLETYAAQINLLHFDMDQARVWNNQLTREFMLRWMEVQQTYVDSQTGKSRWN